MSALEFWKTKPLNRMTAKEWESLCDGCGRCCLHKLEYSDTGEIAYTNVACFLLDIDKCCCRKYEQRQKFVPDCVSLNQVNIKELSWLPSSCAYRCLSEGRELSSWHPLVSGDRTSVHRAGVSIQGRAVPEACAGPLEHHLVDWLD